MFCAYVCCSLFHSPYPLVFFALCVLPDIFFRHCIATFVCRSCAWTRPFMGIINFLPYLRGEWYIKYHISDSCVSDTCYGVIRKSGKKLNAPFFFLTPNKLVERPVPVRTAGEGRSGTAAWAPHTDAFG